MSRKDWLDGLRDDVPARSADDFWGDGSDETTAPSVDESLARNLYDTASAFDQYARLPRSLDLRLVGESATNGRLDISIANDVFHAFAAEVAGAAKALALRSNPAFALAGLSAGSAILHLEPLHAEEPQAPGGSLEVLADKTDGVLERITRLHHLAEAGGDLREFAEQPQLLRALRELTAALDRHDLALEMTWRAGDGGHRESQLTSQGRRNVKTMWDARTTSRVRVIAGRVVGMSLNTFIIKPGTQRKLEIHVNGEDGVVGLDLPLGEQVHIRVDETEEVNMLGIQTQTRLNFISFASEADHLT